VKGIVLEKYASKTENLKVQNPRDYVLPEREETSAKAFIIDTASTYNPIQIPAENDNLYTKVQTKQYEKESYFEGNHAGIPETVDLTGKLETCQICDRSFLADRLVISQLIYRNDIWLLAINLPNNVKYLMSRRQDYKEPI
jgi:hypothetical protein